MTSPTGRGTAGTTWVRRVLVGVAACGSAAMLAVAGPGTGTPAWGAVGGQDVPAPPVSADEVAQQLAGQSDPAPGLGRSTIAENLTEGEVPAVTVTESGAGQEVVTRAASVPEVGNATAGVAVGTAVQVDTGLPDQTVFGNLTAVDTKTGGYTTAWPCRQERPATSVNNFTAGIAATPNFTAVRTDVNGRACFYTAGQAEILWDQYGGTPLVNAHIAVRKFDTRDPNFHGGVRLAAGEEYALRDAAQPGETVLGNLTVVGPAAAGFTSAYPCASGLPVDGNGSPNTSVNNYVAGQVTPNFAAVKADINGDICFFTLVPTHLIWDQVAEVPAGAFTSSSASRILDTRSMGGKVAAGGVRVVETNLPNTTVFGNLTVTDPEAGGYTTLYSTATPNCVGAPPPTSVNNYVAGQTTPNFAAVKTNSLGQFCIYTMSRTHVLWDQTGQSTAFSLAVPVRKLDTRTWGTGSSSEDSHWSLLGAPTVHRWNPCASTVDFPGGVYYSSIEVRVNPRNGGSAEIEQVKAAIAKIRDASGLPLVYAGTTATTVGSGNSYGYSVNELGHLNIDFVYGDPVPSGYAGVGGMYWDSVGGLALYGYVAIEQSRVASLDPNTKLAIYMHEIGHAVGLGHYSDTRQVMNPVVSAANTAWGRGDLHGLSALGLPSWPTTCAQ